MRDEFIFRCVYCLKREMWGQVTCEFDLDHFEPQRLSPKKELDYFNLVYACRRCNAVKGGAQLEDPLILLTSENVVVSPDGMLVSEVASVKRLIRQVDLNSPRLLRWRTMWMRIVDLAVERDSVLASQLIGFPDELPDLAKLHPPDNSRPEGVEKSWYAKKQQGRLPAYY
ncbi:hypothetical protein CGZ80_23415 [Rhodopirellula sp. MGV]|nr:hypothetical protein CGZ80_23415 [Rhodopirellula sp. MGV]PNY33426.1 HNH endonuclease [Rhodopirellula baltica]